MKHLAVELVIFFVAVSGVVGRISLLDEFPITDPTQEPTFEDVTDGAPTSPKSDFPETITHPKTSNETEALPEIVARISYAGSQLWKTYVRDVKDLRTLLSLREEKDITTWGGNRSTVDILVKPDSVEKVTKILEHENITYIVLIEDLQTAIDEENPQIFEETSDRKGHKLTWTAYHGSKDIYEYLNYIAQSYPDICSVQTIGNSVEGRPLKVLKLSNGNSSNKAIWIDGGMHAREWISPAAVTYIINHLVLDLENESAGVRNLDWYFLPLANPDGYEYTHTRDRLWRKNRAGRLCVGTDLNRNFGYKWGGKGASRNPCSETYAGSGPFSEPETNAIQTFITGKSATTKWRASISFHSYGQFILYPWGYSNLVPPDHKDLERVGQKAAAAIRTLDGSRYTVGSAANTLYPAAGGSDDWAKAMTAMKYSYTIELRDTGRHGFVLPAKYIISTAKEALAATRVIAEAAAQA